MHSAQTLVNHPSQTATEQRHVVCSVCHEKFRGVEAPSRLEVLAGLARLRPSSLKEGILLRYANVFPAPELEDPSAVLVFEAKRKHFLSSVYLITAVERAAGGDSGDDVIFGVNLTRDAEKSWAESTSASEPIEVRTRDRLSQRQVESWRRGGVHVELSLGGPVATTQAVVALLISEAEPEGWAIGDVGALAARATAAAASQRGAMDSAGVELRIFVGKAWLLAAYQTFPIEPSIRRLRTYPLAGRAPSLKT